MIIRGFNVVSLGKRTLREIRDDDVAFLAAGNTFFLFMSLAAGQLLASNAGALSISLGAVLLVWAGSSLFGALIRSFNVAYDVEEARPLWKQHALRLGGLAVCCAVAFIAMHLSLPGGAFLRNALTTAAAAALCVAVLKLLPNVRQRWTHVLLASALTTIVWLLATTLFRLYVTQVGVFDSLQRLIGGGLLLLLWIYLSMLVLLIGGELAAEMHKGTGAVDPPHGAIYLGRIVSADGPGTASMEEVKPAR